MAKSATNTSEHAPVVATLKLSAASTQSDGYTIQRKPKWDKCDVQAYKDCISDQLKPFDSFYFGNSKELDILYLLGHFNAVLKLAIEQGISNYKPSTKFKNKRHRPWAEEIYKAIKRCRMEWWEWKKACRLSPGS